MAYTQITTTVQTGKVEDVSDVISMISPTNTPMLTLSGNEKIHNTLYQWQEDYLDAPAQNAQLEGAAAPAANMETPLVRSNGTQIFAKTVQVSGSADAMKLHGPKEWARQMAKKGKEIKRDLEYALVGTRQVQTAATGGVGSLFAGVQAQFDSSVQTNAAAATFTENMLLASAQTCYNLGGEPDKLLTSASHALIIADFAQAAGSSRIRDMEATRKIVNAVDVYVTPFGIELTVVIDRWIAPGDVLLIDPSMWKLMTYRGWRTKALAETGDSRQSEMLGEFGLKHRNYFSGALIYNLAA